MSESTPLYIAGDEQFPEAPNLTHLYSLDRSFRDAILGRVPPRRAPHDYLDSAEPEDLTQRLDVLTRLVVALAGALTCETCHGRGVIFPDDAPAAAMCACRVAVKDAVEAAKR